MKPITDRIAKAIELIETGTVTAAIKAQVSYIDTSGLMWIKAQPESNNRYGGIRI
jgi:hypothetical protein